MRFLALVLLYLVTIVLHLSSSVIQNYGPPEIDPYLTDYAALAHPIQGRFWSPFGLFRTSTVIVSSTSIISTTCTLSTNSTCTASGRRRRAIELPQDEEELMITPSAVFPMESTSGPELEIVRQSRKADPQYFISSSPYSHQFLPHQQPDSVVQSAFGRGYPSAEMPFHPYVSDPRANLRYGFHIIVTMTTTSTTYRITTSTFTPSCSTPGTFAQCPARNPTTRK